MPEPDLAPPADAQSAPGEPAENLKRSARVRSIWGSSSTAPAPDPSRARTHNHGLTHACRWLGLSSHLIEVRRCASHLRSPHPGRSSWKRAAKSAVTPSEFPTKSPSLINSDDASRRSILHDSRAEGGVGTPNPR